MSVQRWRGAGYGLQRGQSLGKVTLFNQALCQPKDGLWPVGRQFGGALEGAGGEAGVAVGQECAAGAEEKGGFVHWPEVAEDVAPVVMAGENGGVLFLDDGRI